MPARFYDNTYIFSIGWPSNKRVKNALLKYIKKNGRYCDDCKVHSIRVRKTWLPGLIYISFFWYNDASSDDWTVARGDPKV